MSSKAAKLGAGASFGRARPVSARRAAIGAATGVPTEGVPDPTELPVEVISHNPDNPRDHLRDLDDLTQSIRELGVINAITVARVDAYLKERPDRADDLDDGAKYVVVDGHRRLEGSRRAGKTTIKVMVDDARVATDESLLESAFVANFHRDDMTDLEQAHALEALVKFYGSQTKAAQRLGISQANISSKLSLLKLSPELQADLAGGRRQVEHVRNLGKLSPEEQRAAADARAAEARKRAEQRRAAAHEPTVDTSATTEPATAGDYHAVISEETGPTDRHPRTDAPEAADGRRLPQRDATAVPAQPRRAEDRATEERITVPWHDVHAVAHLIQEHMSPAERARLIDLLQSRSRSVTAST
ncbi:ParB/RepB/Spo0J family partition protein [Streptomyces sp. TRM43335]|uniref:ParB/RepB/Spo0J family partition protein n=1 Tax=Streptomyces taklimakanensis TaxID=2569853 RepID=A0A6G2BK92_9ACTN|nr:ParB/RepB/Spo0J family partition protein [Streptomyces taklimakanensis]MTE22536.1 ParB/RepB/Spo0J family partition protein [Streptomyces taklimakanensis]